MQGYAYVSLATVLIVLVYFWTMIAVGKARGTFAIAAPAMSGHPEFERVIRIQANTLEQMVIILPSIWLFAAYLDDRIAGALGLLFVLGRILYARGYRADPQKRGMGFMVGGIPTMIAMLGALVGVVWKGFLG